MQNSNALKRKIVILNILIPFLAGTAIDLYVPSLPAITNYFHVPNHLVQLGIGLYMLGYGVGQIFFGILSDSWGRKKVLLGSVIFFTAVSLLAVWSPNVQLLNICRLLQGLAIAGLATGRAVTMDYFADLELTKAITAISISWSLGPIIGPFIGGYLQHCFGWQADFYFFGGYGIALLLYIALFLPETHTNLLTLDLPNIYRVIAAVITKPIFWCYSLLISLTYAALVIFNVIGPFLIQVVLKYSVVEYGHLALFLGAGYFMGNTLSGFLIRYLPPMRVALIGISGGIITSLILAILGMLFKLNLYIVIIPVILLFFCCGFVFANVAGRVLNLFPQNAGTTSAVMGTLQIGGVFLLSTFATVLKTDSQMPLALVYVVMMLSSLLLFLIGGKLKEILN